MSRTQGRHVWLVALFAQLVLASPVFADTLRDTFARGNRAFSRGEYATAIAQYEALVEAGVEDPDVSFNLASAHGSLGHYGQAVRYFERTLRLAPSDANARRALRAAREALGQRQALEMGEAIVADRPPLTEAVFAGLSADTLALILLVSCWLLSIAGVALRFLRGEGARLSAGITAVIALTAALVSGLGLLVKSDWGDPSQRAIVVTEHAALREGPDDAARLARELPEGTGVRVLEREAGYVRVRVGDREGYMRATDVGII